MRMHVLFYFAAGFDHDHGDSNALMLTDDSTPSFQRCPVSLF